LEKKKEEGRKEGNKRRETEQANKTRIMKAAKEEEEREFR